MKTGISDSGLNLTHSRFSTLEVPLPPLNEQKRIVAKIEELFSELDAGEESLRKARRQLGVYRQSLLKQAFEGKLTAAWREQNPRLLESPEQLLARIQAERQARYEDRLKEWKKTVKNWEAGKLKGKKPIKPREAEVVPLTKDAISGLPVLPSPWMWTSLSELSDHIVDGTHKTPKYVAHGVQFISAKDINDFTISFANTRFITPEEHEELWRRCKPSKGDILLTKSGTIGRVAVVKTDHEFSVFESVAVVPISRSVGAQFFAFQIYCTVQGTFGAANQKGVGVRHLHLEDIRKLPTSLPSLAEQQEIVRLLDEQFTVIEQNEREIDTALKRSEALRQSILKKAFSGQLVAQDPADEPAGMLLERIRKERETAKESPRKLTRVPKAKPAPEIEEDFFPGIAAAKPREEKPAGTPGKTDLQAGLVALAIAAHENGPEHLGHVKAEKIVHLCDVIARLQLDRHPVKDAAGPNDFPQAKKVEHRAKMQGWFTVKKKPGAKAYTYQRGRNFDRLVHDTEARLGPQLQTLRDLIGDLAAMSVQDAELVATVHAAWNNLLLAGDSPPTEDAIVREAREDWHPDKLKIPRERFFEAIAWIEWANVVPVGSGAPVCGRPHP